MLTKQAESAIQSIQKEKIQDYKNYWEEISPKTESEYFMRWVFAFLSVHTTWQANINAFNLLNTNDVWIKQTNILEELLIESKVGLHVRRKKGISEFAKDYWDNPDDWHKKPTETWIQCRDRLAKKCHGLGLAKTAFALELCYPITNESVCLDTHMLQLYGFTGSKEQSKAARYASYVKMEQHWVKQCTVAGIPAYIARALFWDTKQKKEDSRYWSYVFENKQISKEAGTEDKQRPTVDVVLGHA